MKDAFAVIKKPVITEKTAALSADGNKIVFWVNLKANKHEIKQAVESIFEVKVAGVNTQRVAGKTKRLGKYAGKTPMRKKAFITLAEGESIEDIVSQVQ